MKLSSLILPLMLATALPLAAATPTATTTPLTVVSGQFYKDGKPFYGIGVNYFDGFTRYSSTGKDMTWKAGLATLHSYNIPVIRINTLGFWPADIQSQYLNNKTAFYSRLDTFLAEAKAQNIGVILDLFWNYTSYSDMNGETMQAWGQQNSATRKMMRAITTEIVTHYKGNSAVWGWEFSNESNSFMDLPAANKNYQYLPGKAYNQPNTRTTADQFDPSVILAALADFAVTARAADPNVPLFSGNNITRANAYHLQTNNWTSDTTSQFGAMISRDNVLPKTTMPALNTLTMHIYPNSEGVYFGDKNSTFSSIVTQAMAESKVDGRPFYLGEFGTDDTALGAAASKLKFGQMTDAILASKVPLSTLWVFDLSSQNGTYNVTSTNSRSYQLDKLKQMNATMATWK